MCCSATSSIYYINNKKKKPPFEAGPGWRWCHWHDDMHAAKRAVQAIFTAVESQEEKEKQ